MTMVEQIVYATTFANEFARRCAEKAPPGEKEIAAARRRLALIAHDAAANAVRDFRSTFGGGV
jgi:hypothetical protein